MPKPSPLPGPRQSNFQARKLLRTGTRHPRLKGDSRPEEGWPVTNWKDVDGGKPGLILLPHECAAILTVCQRPSKELGIALQTRATANSEVFLCLGD